TCGYDISIPEILPQIGKGGDLLVPSLIGKENDKKHGDKIRKIHNHQYKKMIEKVHLFKGVRELFNELKERKIKIAIASSANKNEIEYYLRELKEKIDVVVSGEEVKHTKPEPDIFALAIQRLGINKEFCAVVGDSVWDIIASNRLGIPCIILLSGGNDPEKLKAEHPAKILQNIEELRKNIDNVLAL
ncbi:MAG: HAD-IA family hydrolase, partial [Thermoplasmata archaeon]